MNSQDNSTTERGARPHAHSLSSILARLAPSWRLGRAAPRPRFSGSTEDNHNTSIDDDLLQRIDLLACLFGDEDTKA